jgi:hypothetical protein
MSSRRKLMIVGAALAAGAVAGGAYAATSDTAPRQAFLSDAAKRLHVTPQQLQSALDGAVLDQLQAAVKAGKLTPSQAKELERRMREHRFPPLPFFPGRFHPMMGAGFLSTAARYIGIGESQLLAQLQAGKSLAQVARAHGKSATGLQNAMVAGLRTKLDIARASGRITSSEERRLLSRMETVIGRLVERSRFREHFRPHLLAPPRFGPPAVPMPGGFGPPPLG